jgi:hypothetical protein
MEVPAPWQSGRPCRRQLRTITSRAAMYIRLAGRPMGCSRDSLQRPTARRSPDNRAHSRRSVRLVAVGAATCDGRRTGRSGLGADEWPQAWAEMSGSRFECVVWRMPPVLTGLLTRGLRLGLPSRWSRGLARRCGRPGRWPAPAEDDDRVGGREVNGQSELRRWRRRRHPQAIGFAC